MDLLIFLGFCLLISFVAVFVFNVFLMILVGLYYFIKETIMYFVKVRKLKKLRKQTDQIRSQIIESMAKSRLEFANKNQELAFKSGCEDIKKNQGAMSGVGGIEVRITNGPKAEGLKSKKKSAPKKIVKKNIKK